MSNKWMIRFKINPTQHLETLLFEEKQQHSVAFDEIRRSFWIWGQLSLNRDKCPISSSSHSHDCVWHAPQEIYREVHTRNRKKPMWNKVVKTIDLLSSSILESNVFLLCSSPIPTWSRAWNPFQYLRAAAGRAHQSRSRPPPNTPKDEVLPQGESSLYWPSLPMRVSLHRWSRLFEFRSKVSTNEQILRAPYVTLAHSGWGMPHSKHNPFPSWNQVARLCQVLVS